jgi:HSP20 family protein
MSMIRWEPFNELMSLRQAMDRLFEDSFVTPSRAFGRMDVVMPVDMYQTENEVVVKTAIPGVKREDVDITITGDTVSIKGEKKADEKIKREDYIYQEHRYGAFSRTVNLPGGLDTSKAEASFEDGVLTLTIPKSEEVKPKQIKVKAVEGKKEAKK